MILVCVCFNVSQCDGLSVFLPITNFVLYGSVMLLSVSVLHFLYLFICGWTPRPVPHLGYRELCR